MKLKELSVKDLARHNKEKAAYLAGSLQRALKRLLDLNKAEAEAVESSSDVERAGPIRRRSAKKARANAARAESKASKQIGLLLEHS